MRKIEEGMLILEKNPYSCRKVHIKPHNVAQTMNEQQPVKKKGIFKQQKT